MLPGDFSTALERLAGVGKLVDQSISADDVTERVVDLESRISTAETSVARLRRLLEEAVDLEDVAQIEGELLDRETTLEVLRGQLRTLRDQVDLATITLTITQSPTVLPDTGIMAQAWVSDDADDDPCLGTNHPQRRPRHHPVLLPGDREHRRLGAYRRDRPLPRGAPRCRLLRTGPGPVRPD